MDALEYLKARSRMTNNCKMDCDKCLLGCDKNSRGVSCSGLETNYPKEAIKIVEDWSKEHPIITNKDKYKETIKKVFGDDFDIEVCSENIPDCRCYSIRGCDDCIKFWNSEYIEKEEKE